MTLTVIIILEWSSEISGLVIVVDVIAELLVKSANVVGSGNLMLATNVSSADWITRMLKSWFSVARF